MKKIARKLVAMLMLVSLLTACNADRAALRQMRGLTTRIEAQGYNYDNEDWKQAYEDYKRIDDNIDVKNLRPEEQQEYGELQARCIKEFAKCKTESVLSSVRAYLNQGAGLLKGLLELFGK